MKRFVFIFCLLSFVFINTLCPAQPNGASKKFIPPLVLHDYNAGSLRTNLNGLSDGDETEPGTLYATLIADDGYTRGNFGYSLRMDIDVSDLAEYAFYWIKLGKDIPGKAGQAETADLSPYNYLSFWARNGNGNGGNIKVEFHQEATGDNTFAWGKDISSVVYVNQYLKTGALQGQWQKVVIPLGAFKEVTDWSKMLELVFVFENKTGFKKGIVYVDDIMIGARPSEEAIAGQEVRQLKAPVDSSFKVNGVNSKQCLTFQGLNTLQIRAESLTDNPRIESVRFEYSSDKGNTWRTIGADYGVNKDLYAVEWQPDNSRQLQNYQVRAVATDIYGDEAATGILIDCPVKPMTDDEFLDLIERKAFEFFQAHQNDKTGLFADTTGGGDASIASTGFGLAALAIGAQRQWIAKEDAHKRAILALNTFLPGPRAEPPAAEGKYGFFYHFLNKHTGTRAGKSEISTVDTAILVCGALTAGEYFGGEVKKKADELYKRVEWEQFLIKEKGPWLNTFSMGWSPERGFLDSYWDFYTDEVILISLLAIGSPTHPVPPESFYAWARHKAKYGNGDEFIYAWHGSLFAHQYAHAWFDFRNLVDKQGVNWFKNSTDATLANRQFCIDQSDTYKGYGPRSWGITSMSRPEAYTMHFGVSPTGSGEALHDGTISPTGPAGSMPFTPVLSMQALKNMYLQHPRLWGQYGIRDSFNLEKNWYASTYYGIGVAMMLLPVENFRSEFIWKNFMKNQYIRQALQKAGFTKAPVKARK